VLNALSEVFDYNISKRINDSMDLISQISRSTPFILYNRKPAVFNHFLKIINLVYFHNSPSKSIVNSYYLSDSITRNSKIMSLCSTKFRSKFFNFQ
jgi:hypothetical protein